MILSADELEILEYLKSWNGKPVPMMEIARRAGGRRKFEESPGWSRGMLQRLVEANLITVNERGHYSAIIQEAATPAPPPPAAFPEPAVVEGDYFPSADLDKKEPPRWLAPEIEKILRKSRKKTGADNP